MKKILYLTISIFLLNGLALSNSSAQPPWSDIPIPGRKGKKKEKPKIPESRKGEKKGRLYKDYKTRQLEYKQFYSSFIINDGRINKEERIFLDLKKAELGLSDGDTESIEFLVKLESSAVLQKD